MVSRRSMIIVVGAGASLPAGVSFSQQNPAKIHRIGFLQPGSATLSKQRLEALRAGLAERGYVEGKNLVIEARWAEGKMERVPELAAELVRLKVDVLVTSAAPVIEVAQRATRSIPIVFAVTGDPVGSGLVLSLARPGGNLTGQTLMSSDLAGKWLQIVRELVPGASRVALLALANASGTRLLQEQLRPVMQKMQVELIFTPLANVTDLPGAFATMRREQAQALIVQVNPIAADNRAQIAELAAQHRLVAVHEGSDFTEAGGLISYGPNLTEMFRYAATYVDKILKGAKPGDLPIEQPTKFEMVINLKTARALGIKIPMPIMVQATRVIE